jgi:hypothetical protein
VSFSVRGLRYLNSTHLATILSNPYTLNSVMTHPNPPQPALLVLGSGLWYLRHPSSGGIASWEARIDQVFSQIARGSDPAGATVLADDIVFLPVPAVVPEKLSDERREVLLPSEIDAMNSDLLARLSPISSSLFFSTPKSAITRPSPPLVHLPLSFNDLLDESQTTDGLHYSPMILKVKAQLLLNLQCNDRLSKDFPMDKTCCRRYPGVQSVVQSVVLVMLVCWVSVGKLLEKRLGECVSPNTLRRQSLIRLPPWFISALPGCRSTLSQGRQERPLALCLRALHRPDVPLRSVHCSPLQSSSLN